MPKSKFTEPPFLEHKELYQYLLELHNHIYGLGSDTSGKLDTENIDETYSAVDENTTITGTWTFSTHPLGLDHTKLSNIGSNTHTQIDTHISSSSIHFTEASINHANIQNIGSNSHSDIDAHISGTGSSVHGDSFLLNTGDTASGDYNFANNTLFIDESATKVGFGTNTPSEKIHVEGNIYLPDNQKILFGTGKDIELYFDGTTFYATGSYDYDFRGSALFIKGRNGRIGINTNNPTERFHVVGNIHLPDNEKLVVGTGKDAEIYYNGVDLVLDPDAVGTGVVDIGAGATAVGTVAATLGNVPTGGTAAQTEWLKIKVNGNIRYIPLWS